MKTAVIDIGSNSVRLMLRADGKTLFKKLATTRLGEGVAFTHALSAEAMERTAWAVCAFYEEGKAAGARVCAFATAAVRSAENGGAFCALVKERCGLEIDVVSGSEEALLAINGALGDGDGGVLDVGGASSEVCFRLGGKIVFSVSLNVGAVRLFDLCGDKREKLAPVVGEAISPLCGQTFRGRFCAVGGTATTLAALKLGLKEYDGEKVQDLRLTRGEVNSLSEKLLSLTAEERKNLAGMDERRADIIAGGAYLIAEIMRMLGLSDLYVSDRDNLEGYLTLRGLE